jgi:heptosyltransferase-3
MKQSIERWRYRRKKFGDLARAYLGLARLHARVRWWRGRHPGRPAIAVLLAEQFGDILACEPVLRYLRAQYPTARLYWITRRPFRELLDHHPLVDEVVVEDPAVLFSIKLLRHSPFDRLFNLHLSNRLYMPVHWRLVNPEADRLGIDIRNYFEHGHLLHVFTKVAGLPPLDEPPRLHIPESAVRRVAALPLPKRFVVIHGRSNYPPKDWSVAGWERLVRALIEELDLDVVEVGLESLLHVDSPRYHNYCGRLSLLETAEIIRRADFYVGIDSGPAHFANAVGTFGFILLGHLGAFADYLPYSGDYANGRNAYLIRKADGPASTLTFDEVWTPIRDRVRAGTLTLTPPDSSALHD